MHPISQISFAVSFSCAVVIALPAAHAQSSQYNPPANYYAAATGTGTTLTSQLRTIITTGVVNRSSDSAADYFEILDRDPNNPSRILLVYNRASVDGTWDSGQTFNREHLWPQSYLGNSSTTGFLGDAFNLRPANPSINSSRGNTPFGNINVSPQPTTYGLNSTGGSTYFFPGNADRGDVARSIMYMATRYSGLTLANGTASDRRMGDLASLLRYHYQDAPDEFERRRNQYVYSSSLNPTYFQGNRNPFIDRPEFVWAVFGTGANDSQIVVDTASVPANGGSTRTVNLGRAMAGTTLASQVVTINKSGAAPTTYNLTQTGPIASTLIGTGRTFDYNAQSIQTTLSYTGSVASPASINGSLVVNNTDLTSSAVGRGSQDGDDTISITGTLLGASNASFAADSLQKSLSLDLGIWAQGSTAWAKSLRVFNLPGVAGALLTAGLDLDQIQVSGTPSSFQTNLSTTPSPVQAGGSLGFSANLLTTSRGTFGASFSLINSDENVPGAQTRAALMLSLTGIVALGGDADLNGVVDFVDLVAVARSFNQSQQTWFQGDFDNNGTVDFADLVVLARNFNSPPSGISGVDGAGFQQEWTRAMSVVPEPTTLVCFGGFGLLLGRPRRSRPTIA